MRSHVTATFVLLAFALLAVFTGVRAFALHDLIRDREATHLHHDAQVVARGAEAWEAAGQPVTAQALSPLVPLDTRARITTASTSVTVVGSGYASASAGGDALVGRATSGSTTVVLDQSSEVVREIYRASLVQVLALGILLVALAGVAGWAFARVLTRPFEQLAAAAAALGRGRIDLRLPRSRIPEVRSVAAALAHSAARLRSGRERDEALLQEASHLVRTPLAATRLELEELLLNDDLGPDTRKTVGRVQERLDRLSQAATELIATARSARGTDDDAMVTLEELARGTAEAWTGALSPRCDVRVSVTGDVEMLLTPGPVEQVLDLALEDLMRGASGPVLLGFMGTGEQVQVTLDARPRREPPESRSCLQEVLRMVESLSGRAIGDPFSGGIRIWLPRR